MFFFIPRPISATIVLTLAFLSPLVGQEAPKNGSVFKMNALLISLEDYEQSKLNYAKEDLNQLSFTLQNNFGCISTLIYNNPNRVFSESSEPNRYKKALEEDVIDWCERLKPGDIALLYLSGHGIADDSGKLYFPMINFESEDVDKPFEDAAIPISWIREQFEKSDCRCRLVLLDTCYSGNSKDFGSANDAFQLIRSFQKNTDGVDRKIATFASSGEKEKSWLWEEEKHSLFTYWIIDALSGNADANKDGCIILPELYNYVRNNVASVSENNRSMKPQNPVILNEDAILTEFAIPCPVKKTSEAFEDIYSRIDARLRRDKLQNLIVVPEFTTGQQNDVVNVAEFGVIPKKFADEIRTRLASDDGDSDDDKPYRVIQEAQTRKILKQCELGPANLGTDEASVLKDAPYSIDGVLNGNVVFISPGNVQVTVTLTNLNTNRTKTYSANIFMSPEELGMAGMAFSLKDRQPVDPDPDFVMTDAGLVNRQTLDRVQAAIAENNSGVNPMENPNLPFTLEILSRAQADDEYSKCSTKIKDGVCYVAVDKNEEYAIRLTNNDPNEELYFVKVLVDGLNTVSQTMRTVSDNLSADNKGIHVVPSPNTNGSQVLAPRVSLEEARAWLVFAPDGTDRNVLTINGFCDENGTNSDVYRFKVGDADQSLAARSSYTEKIGMITVALYYGAPKGAGRNARLGTLKGDKERTSVVVYDGDKEPGDLRALYNLRYVSREEFDQL